MLKLTSQLATITYMLCGVTAKLEGIDDVSFPMCTDAADAKCRIDADLPNHFNISNEFVTRFDLMDHLNYPLEYLLTPMGDTRFKYSVRLQYKYYIVGQYETDKFYKNYLALQPHDEGSLRKIYYLFKSDSKFFTIEDPVSTAGTLRNFLLNLAPRRGDFYKDGGWLDVPAVSHVLNSILPVILKANNNNLFLINAPNPLGEAVVVRGGCRDMPDVSIDVDSVVLGAGTESKQMQDHVLAHFIEMMLFGPLFEGPKSGYPNDKDIIPLIDNLKNPVEGQDAVSAIHDWAKNHLTEIQDRFIEMGHAIGLTQNKVFGANSMDILSEYGFVDGPYNVQITKEDNTPKCDEFIKKVQEIDSDVEVIEPVSDKYNLGQSTLSAYQLMRNVIAVQPLIATYICDKKMILVRKKIDTEKYVQLSSADVKDDEKEEFLVAFSYSLLHSMKYLERFNIGFERLKYDDIYVDKNSPNLPRVTILKKPPMLIGGVDTVENKKSDTDRQQVSPPARHMRLLSAILYRFLTKTDLPAKPVEAEAAMRNMEGITDEGKDFLAKLVAWFSCSEEALQHNWITTQISTRMIKKAPKSVNFSQMATQLQAEADEFARKEEEARASMKEYTDKAEAVRLVVTQRREEFEDASNHLVKQNELLLTAKKTKDELDQTKEDLTTKYGIEHAQILSEKYELDLQKAKQAVKDATEASERVFEALSKAEDELKEFELQKDKFWGDAEQAKRLAEENRESAVRARAAAEKFAAKQTVAQPDS